MLNQIELLTKGSHEQKHDPWEKHFMWNWHLSEDFYKLDSENNRFNRSWVMPLIHGFVSQRNISVCSKKCSLILIAKRTTNMAGTRYLKRGIDKLGMAANYVETE